MKSLIILLSTNIKLIISFNCKESKLFQEYKGILKYNFLAINGKQENMVIMLYGNAACDLEHSKDKCNLLKQEIGCIGKVYNDFEAIDSFGITVPQGYSEQLKKTYSELIQNITVDYAIDESSEKDEL